MLVRIKDTLCEYHRSKLWNRWPISIDACGTCAERRSVAVRFGPLIPLPNLDEAAYLQITSVHDAGHAVIGIAHGIVDDRRSLALAHGELDSAVHCIKDDSAVEILLAMYWAEQVSNLRYLEARGSRCESKSVLAVAIGVVTGG